MNAITGLGKYLFALPFAIFGVMHFLNGNAMAGMVPFPGGVIWVYLAGLAMILAAVAIFLGKRDGLATLLLGFLLIIYVLTIHLPGILNAADEMSKAGAMGGLLKDTALAGASFLYSNSIAKEPLKSSN